MLPAEKFDHSNDVHDCRKRTDQYKSDVKEQSRTFSHSLHSTVTLSKRSQEAKEGTLGESHFLHLLYLKSAQQPGYISWNRHHDEHYGSARIYAIEKGVSSSALLS